MAQLKDSIVSGNLRITDTTLTDTLQANIINGVTVGSNPKFTDFRKAFYGTCSTAADTSAKEVTLTGSTTGWALIEGTIIGVRFTNTNTASNVTLNVNRTGAKSIYYGQAVFTTTSSAVCGTADRTHFYMYDGTYWVFISQSLIYSNTQVTQTATTTNANYEILFSKTADNTTRTEEARKANNLKFNPSTGNLQTTQLNGVTIGTEPKFTDTVTSVTYSAGILTITNS